jgi:membrane protein YdbS with pleckstrin-like domain
MGKKIEIEGKRYLTSFISYFPNYILIFLALLFLFLFFQEFGLRFELQPKSLYGVLSLLFFLGILAVVSYLLQEPAFERVIRQYYITDSEVVKVEGILTKKRTAIPYLNVADVRLNQGIIGRIFNYGDVIISGYKDSIVMKGIKNPYPIYMQIKEKISASTK